MLVLVVVAAAAAAGLLPVQEVCAACLGPLSESCLLCLRLIKWELWGEQQLKVELAQLPDAYRQQHSGFRV